MTSAMITAHTRQPASAGASLQGSVLIVDDHANARRSVADILGHVGCETVCCASAAEALTLCQQRSFDCILTDLQMPGMSGLEFIRQAEQRNIDSPIVMITAHASIDTAVEAMRHGALDYLEKPIRVNQLEEVIRRAFRQMVADCGRSRMPQQGDAPAAMIGESRPMQLLRQQIARVAPTHETVLICGESGVGKELVAQAIHAASSRATQALVSVNCPALSPQLMESELFGHTRGAFTSAESSRVGRFELAHNGTLLLDEVTEIETSLQAKLLRVLQEMTLERVGSSESILVNVRVLATTNRNLSQYVKEGNFREDLYYRLAVVPLEIPPLRQRRDDVPMLVEHFLGKSAARLGRAPCLVSSGAIDLLCNYHWPGNVRELENLMTRVSVMALSDTIEVGDIRPWLLDTADGQRANALPAADCQPASIARGESLHDMERKLIEATLEKYEGHRGNTAQALGIGVRTLANKLRSYGYGPRARIGKVG